MLLSARAQGRASRGAPTNSDACALGCIKALHYNYDALDHVLIHSASKVASRCASLESQMQMCLHQHLFSDRAELHRGHTTLRTCFHAPSPMS